MVFVCVLNATFSGVSDEKGDVTSPDLRFDHRQCPACFGGRENTGCFYNLFFFFLVSISNPE